MVNVSVCLSVCDADDSVRLRAVLESAQCNIYSSRQLFKLAQDAYKRAVPPLNSGVPRCRPLLDAALELGLQVGLHLMQLSLPLWAVGRRHCVSHRVPTPPGKSWNCVCKISRTWKVLENEFGPGNLSARSWKVQEIKVQGLASPGICSWTASCWSWKTSELLPAVTCRYGTSV